MANHSTPSPDPASGNESATFLRLPSVMRQTGLGRSTIYRMMAERRFPQAVRLSGRAVGWRSADVRHWADSRPYSSVMQQPDSK